MLFDPSRFVYALVTSTTYGTWLPGDERGFVSEVEDEHGNKVIHNEFGTPYDADMPDLKCQAKSRMKSDPVFLSLEHAQLILPQWQETAAILDWHLFAVAVMSNHFHVVVAAPFGTTKMVLLKQLKGYASRPLNARFGKKTWWTESGSVRFSFDEAAHVARIEYVRNQKNPLLVWTNTNEFDS